MVDARVILFVIVVFILKGVSIALSTMLVELFPKESRGTIGAIMNIFWTISLISLAAFGYGMRNISWRYLQLGLALMSCYSILGYW